jgi:hypothetical protein
MDVDLKNESFTAYGLCIAADFDLQLPVSNNAPDVYWHTSNEWLNQKLWQTNIYRKGVRAKFGGTSQDATLFWEGVGRFRAVEGQYLHYERHTHDLDVFRLFALSEALGLLLFQRGLFLLHGSAVVVNGQATVFVGAPGAGKSSTVAAFAKHNYPILSDDLTAIWFDAQRQPFVLSGFSQLKIWENTVEKLGFDKSLLLPAFEGHNKFLYQQPPEMLPAQPVPLRQILVLQRPYSKFNTPVKTLETPMALLRHFPLPKQLLQGLDLQRHFQDSIRLGQLVDILNLPRPRNFGLLEEWVNTFANHS